MHRYFAKKQRTVVESSSTPSNYNLVPTSIPSVNQERVNVDSAEFSPEDIVSDPGLRKPIENYDILVRDRIRREYIAKGPCQPKGHIFPKTKFGKENRSFQFRWFEKYIWLEYNVDKDASFCFWCYLFKPLNANRFGDDVFVSTGFKNWKKALENFKEHEGEVNSTHDQARVMFHGFKSQRQNIEYNLREYDKEEEVNYRIRLTASLDVIRLLLSQGLAFRGHDESSQSLNRGNFIEILDWYRERKPEVAAVTLENAPGNNQMICPVVQKDLTNCCAVETTKAILEDIGDRNFSLLVDEARDVSIKEQMALVLRYVNKDGEIIERFLALVHVSDTTAKSLKEGIESVFAKHGLSLSRLRGQGYDGASNMRGEFNGLKTLILKDNGSAKYVHCFAHQLQLVVVTVAKDHSAISDFFSIVSMIVNTCGTSCKRRDKLRQVEHEKIVACLESGEITSGRGLNQEMSLKRPGDTRWGSHFHTLLRLKSMLSSIIEVLEHVYEDGSNPDSRGISKTLIMRIESYDFVFILHLMIELLGSTNDLSTILQLRDQNIVQAMSLIDTTKKTLCDFRENGWNQFLGQVDTFCVANSIDVINMEDTIKSRVRMKRDGRVTNYHHYKVEIYCQVLDLLIQEMEHRFPEANTELLSCMNCLSPNKSFANFDIDKLVRLAELYPDNFSCTERLILPYQLRTYISDIIDKVEFSNIEDLGNLAKILVATGRDKAFALVYRLIELTLILPVATASVERVFSAMKLIKTDLRNRMGDEWMNDIMVVYNERAVFKKVDNETILRRFQNMATRRKQLSSNSFSVSQNM